MLSKLFQIKIWQYYKYYLLLYCFSINLNAQVKNITLVPTNDTIIKKVLNKNWILNEVTEPEFNKPNGNSSDSYQGKVTKHDESEETRQILYFNTEGLLFNINIKDSKKDTTKRSIWDFKIIDSKYFILINDMYWKIKELTENRLTVEYLTRGGRIIKKYLYTKN
jgi:hypothetical protein